MLNNQDFMGLGWRNDVGSLPVKDQSILERAKSDEDRLNNGLKWSYDYFDHDHTDINLQTVPEIHREEEEKSKRDLLVVVVPDEHSETGMLQQSVNDDSDNSDNRCYLRNKQKRRRIRQVLSVEESEEFTREVPSVTRKGSKRIRRDEMSDKMRTLQQLVPNCHKTDNVSVLDKAIEYMKNLQLQLQVMSMMGMNPYFPPAMLDFGIMQNHLLTAMAVNRTASSPLFPASNWPLTQFTNLSFQHSTVSSSQSLHGFVQCLPNFHDFSTHTMGRL